MPIEGWVPTKKPIPRQLNSALLFSRWLLGMKTNKPIQLLVDRVRTLSDDELPAIKTAEKVLSSLSKEYNVFNQKVKQEIKIKLKLKESKKLMISKRNKIVTV